MADEPQQFDLDAAIEATVAKLEEPQAGSPVDEPLEQEISVEAEADDAVEADTETVEAEADTGAGVEINPPASWTKEAKEMFAALPPETQQYIAQRESERDKYLTETGQKYKQTSAVTERLQTVLQPYESMIQETGLDAFSALENMLKAAAFAQQDLPGYIRWLQSMAGEDAATQEVDDEFIDPSVKQLRQQVSGLNSQLSNMQREQLQRQQHAVAQYAETELQSFVNAKDGKGAPQHPHFDQVRVQMAGLMQSGAAETLADAYEQAVWLVPEVRQKMIEAEQKAKVAKAKAAAGRQVTPKAVSPTKPSKSASWEDTLERVANEIL